MMLRTMIIAVGTKQEGLYEYLTDITENTKNLRNAATFLLRNIYTGLAKDAEGRHQLEQEAIQKVTEGLTRHNYRMEEKRMEFLRSERYLLLDAQKRQKAYESFCRKHGIYTMPDRKNRVLSSMALTTVMQEMKDPDYYALPGQVNQRAVLKSAVSFKSGIAGLSAWKKDPSKFLGRPCLPGYIRSSRTTASFSSQICKIKKNTEDGRWYLSFPKTKEALCLGHRRPEGELQAVEVVPAGTHYDVMITSRLPDPVMKAPHPEGERIYALDPGVNNFVTVAGNFEMVPFIMDGRILKSRNRLYNKKKAGIMSEVMQGRENGKGVHIEIPEDVERLSCKRKRYLRDTFYKMAHYICRRAEKEGVTLIVAGKNRNWKQEGRLGKEGNQNFVFLPHGMFFHIMKITAEKYGIRYEEQEESYTSKADFLAGDPIPVYGETGAEEPVFSGRRIHRGQYCSKNGTLLNADVNGAVNILRKYKPEAFSRVTDFQWLSRTVEKISYRRLQPIAIQVIP